MEDEFIEPFLQEAGEVVEGGERGVLAELLDG